MKLQVKQASGAHELTIGSQKEFLQLWNRGVIAADDLVRRGDRWVRAAELPWIEGMARERKRDGRRLFWITLILMLLGLAGGPGREKIGGGAAGQRAGGAGQPMVDKRPCRRRRSGRARSATSASTRTSRPTGASASSPASTIRSA